MSLFFFFALVMCCHGGRSSLCGRHDFFSEWMKLDQLAREQVIYTLVVGLITQLLQEVKVSVGKKKKKWKLKQMKCLLVVVGTWFKREIKLLLVGLDWWFEWAAHPWTKRSAYRSRRSSLRWEWSGTEQRLLSRHHFGYEFVDLFLFSLFSLFVISSIFSRSPHCCNGTNEPTRYEKRDKIQEKNSKSF